VVGLACPSSAPRAADPSQAGAASASASASGSGSTSASASAATVAREKVRFGRGEPRVGERQRFESEERVRMTMPGRGPVKTTADAFVEGERVVAVEEVLAVSGPVAVKVRVKFERWVSYSGPDERPQPQDGKTYVVERVGHDVRVTSEAGAGVSAEEEAPIAKRYDRIGEPIELGLVLPDRTIEIGERVPELEAALPNRLMGSDDPMKPRDVVVKLAGLEQAGTVAVFDATMTMGGRAAGNMEAKVAGKIRLRVSDGRELEIAGQGPFTMKVTGAAPATGTLSLRITHEYL
jgi:hypothetical protein